MNADSQRRVRVYVQQLREGFCVGFTADAVAFALGANRYDVLEVLDELVTKDELTKRSLTDYGFPYRTLKGSR